MITAENMPEQIANLVKQLGEKEGEFVLSSSGENVGTIIGEADDCGVEGCTGTPYLVEWENKKNVCCGKGMNSLSDNVQIII